MQRALIVRDDAEGTLYLDKMLDGHWRVVSMCAMPSSVSLQVSIPNKYNRDQIGHAPTCLVILEKT